MDEVKFKSDFATKLLSRFLVKRIKKSTGYDIDIKISDVYISIDDGDKAHLQISANAEINKDDLKKIVEEIV